AGENIDSTFPNMLKTILEDGRVTLIGATTIKEQSKFMAPVEAWEDRFEKIRVPEPTQQQSEIILRGLKPYFEKEFGMEIAADVLHEVVEQVDVCLASESYPRKAVDTLRKITKDVFNDFNT